MKKKATKAVVIIDPNKPFQFIEVTDTGGDSCCPHCGATGRYIYHWAEFGKMHSAMAGCYKALTGRLDKDDVSSHIERIFVKQAHNKPLNGWDNTILRMLDYKAANQEDSGKTSWAENKIIQAVADVKTYSFRKFH